MEYFFSFSFTVFVKVMTAKREKSNKRERANERERDRMLAINMAYDRLRNSFPLPQVIRVYEDERDDCNVIKKLSKIETLRLACNYIQLLKDVLEHKKKVTKSELVKQLSPTNRVVTSNLIKMDQKLMQELIVFEGKGDEQVFED